jgi:Tol biopolymer transport system component
MKKMKKIILYLSLFLALTTVLLDSTVRPARAGEPETLDTILARSAAESFLVTLTRPDLAGVMEFYVQAERVRVDGLVAELRKNPATDYEIGGAAWVSAASYQVKATLQPGNRPITVYTGKYDGRWQVDAVDWSPATAAGSRATTAATVTAAARPNGQGKLVFQTRSGGDIYVVDADGSGLRRITDGIDPQLSPDGTQIAFTRWTPRYELFTINLDGSGERAWTQGWREMKSPTWSADGTKLVFAYQSGGRLDEENVRVNLAKAAAAGEQPKIPDYARDVETDNGILTYRIPADAYWNLKAIDLKTMQVTDLATERHSYGPSAHPSQANLVIYRGDNGLAVHDLDTGRDRPLTGDSRDHTPVISPDGSRIAVSYWQDGHWEVHTLSIDGSQRRRLTETPLTVIAAKTQLTSQVVDGKARFVPGENPHWNNAAPTWSPDGSQIAFLTDRSGRWEIWVMNADGSDQRPMFPAGALKGLTLAYAGVDERMLSWR